VRVFDGLSALTIFTVYGSVPNAELGRSLAAAGDVNGDQAAEVLVARPGAGSGQVQVMSSVKLGVLGSDHVLSLAGAPGPIQLDLDFGSGHAGRPYLVLGTLGGTAPGTPFGTLTLPLDGDRYFNKTAKLYAFGTLTPPQGLLDAGGRATVSFRPPGSASAAWLVGRTFHHAAVVLDTQGNTLETTNAWPVTIVP
jgi:hypothetical protein